MTASNFKKGQHIMFSYGWDIQKDVLEIYHRLQARNIPVWMDIQGGMKDYLTVSMSEAIENAAAVCCFITSKYQSSPYCKKELLYAQDCKIPLIPCLMDADPTWRPTEWLGYAVIDILYIDCRDLLINKTPENLEAKCERLIHRIHMAVDPTVLAEVKHEQKKPDPVISNAHPAPPSSSQVSLLPPAASTASDQKAQVESEQNESTAYERYLAHPMNFI